jgi:hypothetical protein
VAIDYSLEIATGTPAARVAEELFRIAGTAGGLDRSVAAEREPEALITADRLLDGVVLSGGLWVRVLEPSTAPWHVLVTDLGMTATVRVAFRLNKFASLVAQQDDLVRLTLGLLDTVAGDAVLHRELETVWLLRRGGQVSLHERDDLWTSERLAMVGARPHRRSTWSFE